MPDTSTDTVLLTEQRVTFWDSSFELLESRDLTVELRQESTVARIALPSTDDLAQSILEGSFEGSGYAPNLTIDRDGERWSGWLAELTVTTAAGVRVVELLYVDQNHKSEFAKLLEAL
ncbi:hypothetical protein M1M07_28460 [Rhodococcus sp. HM1]|uniref:hypothetical protein n=1 Tax=Rhodococcus sp. HM1 TaxID=2937759 RepID=UPI00200AB170|nr:hypothetical protein [Rhodococcus sp. HM1]MCK8675028.1 hypothetical protein [Rhodococcus sp. HM1]